MLHPLDTSVFRVLEGRVYQSELRTSADLLFWNDDSPSSQRSFVVSVRTFSNQTATSFKSSTFVRYPENVVLLNFCKIYKVRMIKSERSLVAFPPVDFEKSKNMTQKDIARLRESVYSCSTS